MQWHPDILDLRVLRVHFGCCNEIDKCTHIHFLSHRVLSMVYEPNGLLTHETYIWVELYSNDTV